MPYRRYRISVFPQYYRFPIPFAVPLTALCNHLHVAYLDLMGLWRIRLGFLTQSFKVVTKPQCPQVSLRYSLFMHLLHTFWIWFVGAILLCNKRLKYCGGCDSCLPCDQKSCSCLEFFSCNSLSLTVPAELLQWENKKKYLCLPCTQMYTQNLWNQLGA